jgi:hypothetical protein
MDSFGISNILKIVSDFGLVGLVIFLWWSDNKRIWAVIDQHKKDMAAVMERYQRDMTEQREMYRANASLCRDFAGIAADLRDIVTLNIQTMTQLNDSVRGNQFCPMIRIHKEKTLSLVPRPMDGG